MLGGSVVESNKRTAKQLQAQRVLVDLIGNAVEEASDGSGWAALSGVGSLIVKRASDFDTRRYGDAKLREIIEAIKLFELERREMHFYARSKKARTPGGGVSGFNGGYDPQRGWLSFAPRRL
jgi:hypothetical protein